MFSQEIKKAPQRKSEWKSKKPKRIFMSNAQKGTHFYAFQTYGCVTK